MAMAMPAAVMPATPAKYSQAGRTLAVLESGDIVSKTHARMSETMRAGLTPVSFWSSP
jgi:hypothetical protein